MESKDKSKPNNDFTVISHDNYIEVLIKGSQTRESMHKGVIETELATKNFIANKKSVQVLVQLADLDPKFNFGAFKESLKVFRLISFNRIAVCGEVSKTMMIPIDTVINSFSHEFEMKYFSTRDDAVAWLNTQA
jgi:SpoIIAA-like